MFGKSCLENQIIPRLSFGDTVDSQASPIFLFTEKSIRDPGNDDIRSAHGAATFFVWLEQNFCCSFFAPILM